MDYNLYHSAPVWLKAALALSIFYLSYRIWSKILRTRRELQAASWILNVRRKAGIPDSDKRPFKIARAAVDANKKNPTNRNHSVPPKEPTPTTKPLPSSSESLADNPQDKNSQALARNQIKTSSNTIQRSNQIHLTNDRTPDPKSHHRLTPASSSRNPLPSPKTSTKVKPQQPLIDKSHHKRVAPISTDGSDSEHSETEAERLASRNRKKPRTQKPPYNSTTPSTLNPELAAIDSTTTTTTSNVDDPSPKTNQNGFKGISRKKRILSDCLSEVDADQATRIKKGRSEKVSDNTRNLEGTPEAEEDEEDEEDEEQEEQEQEEEQDEGGDEDLMRVDQEEDVAQDQAADKERGDKPASDDELYIIADNGQKKKLVKIRLSSPESVESNEDGESNIEQRWVTHKEFRRLKQNQQLVMDDDGWDSETVMSSSSSLDSDDVNRLSTPSKQSVERGPIWSIEGKARSNPILHAASEMPLRIRPVSRPRNSLGRMRLSLPPDPASPSQLPRSRLMSPLRPSLS